MRIFINLSNKTLERYYDHNDIIDEKIDYLYPFIAKHVDVPKIQKAAQEIMHETSDKILYLGEQFYTVLHLTVKRSALFSRETIKDRVENKVMEYKIAHGIDLEHKINMTDVFLDMYKMYCETAAKLVHVDYKKFSPKVKAGLMRQLYYKIGVTG